MHEIGQDLVPLCVGMQTVLGQVNRPDLLAAKSIEQIHDRHTPTRGGLFQDARLFAFWWRCETLEHRTFVCVFSHFVPI